MNKKINIVLADDEVLFREGISFILKREKNITVVHEVSDGSELIAFLNSNATNLPDIILMDLKMPLLNGVEATKIINATHPNIKIIALTSYNTNSFIANMINVGAASYLVKNTTPLNMIHTINQVYEKGYYYDENVLKVIHDGILSSNNKTKSNLDNEYLTSREKVVLKLICQQLTTNQISEMLFVSPRTVEGYRSSLFLKTESKNIAGLVVFAIQNQIIDIDNL